MSTIDRAILFVAKHAGKERPTSIRIITLVLGFLVFLVFIPLALGVLGHRIAIYATITIPRIAEVSLGMVGISVGLFFLIWSVLSFWFIGRGTPVPFASPVRLVTNGPFKYTRNPIKLGAVLFYFGIGTIWDHIVTGVIMLTIGVILGTLYHRGIEEKELSLRFGNEYEQYRERTSFLIPMPPRKVGKHNQ
jgi:protein-S-isoprenylcysteine O-methyltransferase Ste14